MNDKLIDFLNYVVKNHNEDLIKDEKKKKYFCQYLKKSSVANKILLYDSAYNFAKSIHVQFENVDTIHSVSKLKIFDDCLFELNENNIKLCCDLHKKNGYTFSGILNSNNSKLCEYILFNEQNVFSFVKYIIECTSNYFNEENEFILSIAYCPYLDNKLRDKFLDKIENTFIDLSAIFSNSFLNNFKMLLLHKQTEGFLCEKIILHDKAQYSWNNLIVAYSQLSGNDVYKKFINKVLKQEDSVLNKVSFCRDIDITYVQFFLKNLFEEKSISETILVRFLNYMGKNKFFIPDIMYNCYTRGNNVVDDETRSKFTIEKIIVILKCYLNAPYHIYYQHSSLICYLVKGHISECFAALIQNKTDIYYDGKLDNQEELICIYASLLYNNASEKSINAILTGEEFYYVIKKTPINILRDVFNEWKKVYDNKKVIFLMQNVLKHEKLLYEKMMPRSTNTAEEWMSFLASLLGYIDNDWIKKALFRFDQMFHPHLLKDPKRFERIQRYHDRIRDYIAKNEYNM